MRSCAMMVSAVRAFFFSASCTSSWAARAAPCCRRSCTESPRKACGSSAAIARMPRRSRFSMSFSSAWFSDRPMACVTAWMHSDLMSRTSEGS